MQYPNDYSFEVRKAWHGMERQGMSWQVKEMKGMAWKGKARHGMTWKIGREKGMVYNHPCERDKEGHKHT
jgi:hypothetical protein